MDFSRAGYVHSLTDSFRARVQWKEPGGPRECYGPRRPDEETAQDDLDAMRAAAGGMSREGGYAAMEAEAERLKAGKPPSKQGSVELLGDGYRARIQWRATGEMSQVYGPRRAEEKRAQADLEAMREAAVTGGPRLRGVLSLYPFGTTEGLNGTSLAMYPVVGFAFQAQGCVSKGRRFLSDAPFRWFP